MVTMTMTFCLTLWQLIAIVAAIALIDVVIGRRLGAAGRHTADKVIALVKRKRS